MKKAYAAILEECTFGLPVQIQSGSDQIEIDFSNSEKLKWKNGNFKLADLSAEIEKVTSVSVNGSKVSIDSKIKASDFNKLYQRLLNLNNTLRKENLEDETFWGHSTRTKPTGFNQTDTPASSEILKELYEDDFIVPEKKPFVIDLDASHGSYMVSVAPERHSIVDGAAQIASLSLGFNDPMKRSMGLRPEIFDSELNLNHWDIFQGFTKLLKDESGLPHLYVVNSGAEAIETAVRAAQVQFPERKKLIAFEGSFHGRSLLAIHTTFNPAKRQAFEVYPGLVEFNAFPETKDPFVEAKEPANWVSLWGNANNSSDFDSQISEMENTGDELLKTEIQCLLDLKKKFEKEKFLALLIEPMQCEGGDRYGTARFFRGLRLLTRAYETPLIIDEVQTGLGLGGTFLWHKLFNFVDKNGNPDAPDSLCLAKKTQIAFCLSQHGQDVPVEQSPASVYRGYLQALAVKDYDYPVLEKKVEGLLKALQKTLDEELVSNPRNMGLAFAFDLPSNEILMKLIAERFTNGTIFYPAGDRTARFRLMASTSDRELIQIFTAIFQCFQNLNEKKIINGVPEMSEWIRNLPKEFQDIPNEKNGIDLASPWKSSWIPKSKDDLEKMDSQEWKKVFRTIVDYYPQILRSQTSLDYPAKTLAQVTTDELWKRYETDSDFALLDLMWTASRAFGHSVTTVSAKEVQAMEGKIRDLESATYEPERQDDPKSFLAIAEDPNGIVLVSNRKDGAIAGISAAGPLYLFKHIHFIGNDPLGNDEKALYSMDLTVHPEEQAQGLGLRLKCEQYIQALKNKCTVLRSRNRDPDAKAMMALNRKLSSAVIDRNPKDYGGKGVALYQSISLHPEQKAIPIYHPFLAPSKNKTSLANFISPTYAHNLLFLKEILPEQLKHLYLASGRCESIDKMVKLLRAKKPKGKTCFSIRGDYFGGNTAAARSLGGDAGPSFFDWPLIPYEESKPVEEQLKLIESHLKGHPSDEILGLFVEPLREKSGSRKSEDFLKGLIEVCHQKEVPVIFQETGSHLYKYNKNHLFAADGFDADGVVLYPGAQLGIVAVKKELFLEKPLMMISTWDGDEHSLNLFRKKVLGQLKG